MARLYFFEALSGLKMSLASGNHDAIPFSFDMISNKMREINRLEIRLLFIDIDRTFPG
jgi:hypothetical protein